MIPNKPCSVINNKVVSGSEIGMHLIYIVRISLLKGLKNWLRIEQVIAFQKTEKIENLMRLFYSRF